MHGAEFVFDNPTGVDGAVGKTRQNGDDVGYPGAQLDLRAASDRGVKTFTGGGMAAERVGPHAGPGFLLQGAACDK